MMRRGMSFCDVWHDLVGRFLAFGGKRIESEACPKQPERHERTSGLPARASCFHGDPKEHRSWNAWNGFGSRECIGAFLCHRSFGSDLTILVCVGTKK